MNNETLKGYLAISKAGRDKGELYVIWDEANEYVYLVDGKYKKLDNPKKKKKKHITIVKHRSEALINSNEDIKLVLKRYKSVRNV